MNTSWINRISDNKIKYKMPNNVLENPKEFIDKGFCDNESVIFENTLVYTSFLTVLNIPHFIVK